MPTKKTRTISSARKMTTVAIMSAVSIILMFLDFPVPFMPGFIKFDISELPALLTAFLLGPWYGALVCLLKNLLHLPITSTACVGELSNFILGCFFVIPAGYIYRHDMTKKGALKASLTGATAMGILSWVTNYFFVYPAFIKLFHMPEQAILAAYQAILPSTTSLGQAILVFNVPFTFLKGMVDVAITFLVYKRISPIIHGTASISKKEREERKEKRRLEKAKQK